MKIARKAEEFRPVTITLETQEELSMMFAIFNSIPISRALDKASSTGSMGGDVFKMIRSFTSTDRKEYPKFKSKLEKLTHK